MSRRRALTVAFATALALCGVTLEPGRAEAETCAAEPVEVHGENARYVWLAKTKARANWRRRVRSTPGLGPDYANWNRAANADERCLTGPAGTVCILTGTPCKP